MSKIEIIKIHDHVYGDRQIYKQKQGSEIVFASNKDHLGFNHATTKTPMQRIKDMESQLIRLGVDPNEFEDKDELDENEIKRKSTLKPTNQDKIDAMIKEARELRQLIQDIP